jgi:hypothetical protein
MVCAGCAVAAGRLVGLDVEEKINIKKTNKQRKAGLVCAGCAVAAGRLVGLDVEESARRPQADPLRLARRRFSAAETAALEGNAQGFCHPSQNQCMSPN